METVSRPFLSTVPGASPGDSKHLHARKHTENDGPQTLEAMQQAIGERLTALPETILDPEMGDARPGRLLDRQSGRRRHGLTTEERKRRRGSRGPTSGGRSDAGRAAPPSVAAR